MSVSGRLVLLGFEEIEVSENAPGSQTEICADNFAQVSVSHTLFNSAIRVYIQGERFFDTDSVG